jgi:hypothetical protein
MKRLRCCHCAALLAEDNSAPGCSRYEKPHGQNKEEGRKVWRSPSVCVLTLKTVDYSRDESNSRVLHNWSLAPP